MRAEAAAETAAGGAAPAPAAQDPAGSGKHPRGETEMATDAKRRRTSATPPATTTEAAALGDDTQTASPQDRADDEADAEANGAETAQKANGKPATSSTEAEAATKRTQVLSENPDTSEGPAQESSTNQTQDAENVAAANGDAAAAERGEQVFDFCRAKDLAMGAEIEVKWDVKDTDNGSEKPTWFSAVLDRPADETLTVDDDPDDPQDHVKIQVHIIRYAPMGEFPEDVRKVCFVNEHQLLDVETEEHQVWRLKGDTFDGDPQVMEAADAQAESELRILDVAMQRITVLGERVRECRDESEKAVLSTSLRELATELMNGCLAGTFERLRLRRGLDLNAMPANRQNFMTDVVVRVKEAMIDRLVNHVQSGQAVDAAVVRDLLNEAVAEAMAPPGAASASTVAR